MPKDSANDPRRSVIASFFFAPDPVQSTFLIPGGNTPGNGAQLFIYVAGSVSTPTTVYKDNAGNAAWSNPIVLDSGGNLPLGGVVWIPAGVTIKAVWAPANDTSPPTSPYRTIDNIAGINDTTASATDWIPGPAPTFISSTQFTLVGDQTAVFTKSRRLKFTVTAGTVYGTISSSSFGAVTTVNVAFSAGALDSGLSSVFYSLIDPSLPSVNSDYSDKLASTVPSSGNGTTNIWGVAGNSVSVTGTNAIFNFSTAPYAGAKRTLIFAAALSLNSSASNLMPGNLNVTTAANDRAEIYAPTTSSNIISFYKASGRPVLVAAGDFAAQVSNAVLIGPSSGANAIPTFRPLVAADVAALGTGMTLITSAAAAQSAAIDFTQISALYNTYVVDIFGAVPQTNAAGLTLRMSNDGGATYKAGAGDYVYANQVFTEAGALDNSSSQAATFILLAGAVGISNVPTAGGFNGRVILYNANSSSQRKVITTVGFYPNNSVLFASLAGGGANFSTSVLVTSAVNAIRFIEGSGNISSGTFTLYGMNK